jgi:Leucine-rich repeat (LRR) protein
MPLPETVGFIGFSQQFSLQGQLSADIGLLTNIHGLHMNESGLRGSIPTQLGLLTKLTALHLAHNELAGTIPSALGYLTLLTDLNLDRNRILRGTIPLSLAALTRLQIA